MLSNSRYFKTDGPFRESIHCALSLADGACTFSCLSRRNLSCQSSLKSCLVFFADSCPNSSEAWRLLPSTGTQHSIVICSRLKNLPRDVCFDNLVSGLIINDTHMAWCSVIVVNRNCRFKSILLTSKVYI